MVEYYIERYNFYRKSKADQYKPYGKIKIPKTSKKVWESIVMDWIVKLPLFKKPIMEIVYNLIFIIMDLLIKYTYFILYIKKLKTEELVY